MTHKNPEQRLHDAVACNIDCMVDRAMLCPNELARAATPHNYHVFKQVGYIAYNKVHAEVYNSVRELLYFHLWPNIRNNIFNFLHGTDANT